MKKITKFLNNFFKETEEGCYQPESDVKTDPPMDEKQQYLLPIVGNTYWMIDAYGDVHKVAYRNDLLMNKMLHNCFFKIMISFRHMLFHYLRFQQQTSI